MKDDFFKYQAQTSPHPLAMEVSHADGSYIFDTNNNAYLDFVAGVSACTLGHRHPKIVNAIKVQLDKYLHVMVYGEYAQNPSVQLAKLLSKHLPKHLEQTYLVNSGTEAIEGALKLARRATGRQQIIAAKQAYHGNTMGALSLMDYKERVHPFQPLIGSVDFIGFNNFEDIQNITSKTACVVLETIQGGAGFIVPQPNYLQDIKAQCDRVGALLILDEIQPGFGRTGPLFSFEHFNVIPDILVMGKGMGGGMPIGAFCASKKVMSLLSHNPKLGHITTFGGHPVIAAAALATLQELTQTHILATITKKERLFKDQLKHPLITDIRGKGLMLALMLPTAEIATQLILKAQDAGLILFWLLYETKAVRITPPLTITEEEIIKGCGIIIDILNSIKNSNTYC